jgi:hypothetical protein
MVISTTAAAAPQVMTFYHYHRYSSTRTSGPAIVGKGDVVQKTVMIMIVLAEANQQVVIIKTKTIQILI